MLQNLKLLKPFFTKMRCFPSKTDFFNLNTFHNKLKSRTGPKHHNFVISEHSKESQQGLIDVNLVGFKQKFTSRQGPLTATILAQTITVIKEGRQDKLNCLC